MDTTLQDLARIIERCAPTDGFHESPVAGVHCIKRSRTAPRSKYTWRASLSIVAQGSKEVVLGRKAHQLDAARYVATPIRLPVISRIATATPAKPFLCVMVDLNPVILNDLSARLVHDFPKESGVPARALFSGTATDKMLDAALRLAQVFDSGDDARILGPLVVNEILYHLLKGPEGAAIRQFVRAGSTMHKISHAVFALGSDLAKDVDVAELARLANMSRSAFFRHFREVTAMSPIQYQKRLRLHEARRLMIQEEENAESSSFKVGYHSPSQFSREYSRMFGAPPARDALRARATT